MNIKKPTPRYGQIVVHANAAGYVYSRFLEVCEDDPKRFRCRIVDPTTMRVVRWTEKDVEEGRCMSHAVGMPVMGWGYLHQIKHAGNVDQARKYWDTVHYGPVVNKEQTF